MDKPEPHKPHTKPDENKEKGIIASVRDEVRQAIDLLERGSTVSAALKLSELRHALDQILKEVQT